MVTPEGPSPQGPPQPSALSNLITNTISNLTSPSEATPTTPQNTSLFALPIEILHNLRYQHSWHDLRLHSITPTDGRAKITEIALPNLHGGENDSASNRKGSALLDSAPSNSSGNNVESPSTTHSPTESQPAHQYRQPIYILSGIPPKHAYIHPDLQSLLLKHGLSAQDDLSIQREWVVPLALGSSELDIGVRWLSWVFDSLEERDVVRLGTKNKASVQEKSGADTDLALDKITAPPTATTAATTKTNRTSSASKQPEVLPPQSEPLPQTRDPQTANSAETPHQQQQQQQPKQPKQQQYHHQDPKRVLLALKSHSGLGGDGTIAYYICAEGEVKPRQNG